MSPSAVISDTSMRFLVGDCDARGCSGFALLSICRYMFCSSAAMTGAPMLVSIIWCRSFAASDAAPYLGTSASDSASKRLLRPNTDDAEGNAGVRGRLLIAKKCGGRCRWG
jgi:hypothetical protein